MAFQHDLALMEATESHPLPMMIVPAWHATFSPQFARPEAGLTPKPAFILQHACRSKNRKTGHGISKSSKAALISGADYIFEGEHVKRSLIWRTDPDGHPMQGMSGSVLCLGQPADRQVHALLFENFETPLLDKQYVYHIEENPKGFRRMVTFKGGFFLPEDVLNNAVIEVERESDLSQDCASASAPTN
ncbi:hypothetical protein B0H12DRAFT_1124663 [Mycena haematopus]|nr:hypothetical protein B0H12DRAFT_1124663 [Mycena haematopus]